MTTAGVSRADIRLLTYTCKSAKGGHCFARISIKPSIDKSFMNQIYQIALTVLLVVAGCKSQSASLTKDETTSPPVPASVFATGSSPIPAQPQRTIWVLTVQCPTPPSNNLSALKRYSVCAYSPAEAVSSAALCSGMIIAPADHFRDQVVINSGNTCERTEITPTIWSYPANEDTGFLDVNSKSLCARSTDAIAAFKEVTDVRAIEVQASGSPCTLAR